MDVENEKNDINNKNVYERTSEPAADCHQCQEYKNTTTMYARSKKHRECHEQSSLSLFLSVFFSQLSNLFMNSSKLVSPWGVAVSRRTSSPRFRTAMRCEVLGR